MEHYGDISALNGADIAPVDIITFGSPCQDMSIAGKRSGLDGERSCLFYQAVRIVKEMRCKTNGKYPRFVVWENVPGAFSSNKGQDFRAVLEEICRVKDEFFSVPESEKWANSGEIVAEDFSLAWRVFDAQFWGVPQRRKRIYLVADFAGRCAGKILFESEGVSGYSAAGFRAWQETSSNLKGSSGTAGVLCLNDQGGSCMNVAEETVGTLRAEAHHPPCVLESLALENHPTDWRVKLSKDNMVQTLLSRMGTGGGNVPLVMTQMEETPKTLKIRSGREGGGKGALIQENRSATLSCNNDQTLFVPLCKECDKKEMQAYGICAKGSNAMKSGNPYAGFYEADTSRTLDRSGGNPSCNQGGIAVVSVQGSMIGRNDKNGPKGSGTKENVSFTLNTIDHHAVAYRVYCTGRTSFFTSADRELASTLEATDYKDPPIVNDRHPEPCKEPGFVVRRLTPTECARLQGFPDWWCDGLGVEEPSEEELVFWRGVFETHRKIMGMSGRPKSDKQIIKWLRDPHSDSAEYKMWGNGVALPNVYFVLSGIAYYSQYPEAV